MAERVNSAGLPMEREITLIRIFDAPRELVFQMWTDPAHVAQWWGPSGFTNPVCKVDARPGGAIHIVMRAPNGMEHPMNGVFQEFSPPEKIVFTNNALDKEGNPILKGLTTVTFADENGKTRLTLKTSAVALVDYGAQHLAGMNAGWSQSLDCLAEHLANA